MLRCCYIPRHIHFYSTSLHSLHTSSTSHEILTLLHRTTTLLPRILAPRSKTSNATESLEFWNNLLSNQYNDLTSMKDRPARIAVYGVDEWSGAKDLVTALLEEPLSSDPAEMERIRNRWKDRSQRSLTISQQPSPTAETSTLRISSSSSYLRHFPIPLDVTELLPAVSSSLEESSSFVFDEVTLDALLAADTAIIVCNPLATPLTVLPIPIDNPNTILVLTCTPSPELVQAFKAHFLPTPRFSGDPWRSLRIFFVDPSRAVIANTTLRSDPRSPLAVQRYQDEFAGSRMSTFTTALREQFSLDPNIDPNIARISLHSRTSLGLIRGALGALRTTLKHARSEVEGVCMAVSRLNGTIEEAKIRAHRAIFGRPAMESFESSVEGDVVIEALESARKEVSAVIDSLTWWKMVWNVDEISPIISQAVTQAWCRDLEKQLIMQTGRLTALQVDVTKSLFALLAAHDNSPFNSAVLLNSLRQRTASPSYTATPEVLTGPIEVRRTQIIEHPTTRLHVAGQRAVLGMSGAIVTGASISWAGWFGWLTGNGDGLLGFVGLDVGTALGVGLLSAMAGIRWAAGKWERSKQRWWEDWNRVGDGLGRDLRVTLDQTMSENILGVATYGCDRLSEIAKDRRGEVEELEEQLDLLTQTLEALEQRSE